MTQRRHRDPRRPDHRRPAAAGADPRLRGPLLGRVGEVTAEIIEEHPEYHPGDMAGLSGLEARYDDAAARARPGVRSRRCPSRAPRASCSAPRPRPATRCVLSLDVGLETEAEQLLAGVGPASALVAIRPSTGEILAAANGPGNGGQNLATFGQFAPGSTFKTVSSLALLRAGLTPRHRRAVHADDHGRRQAVQELLRLPEQRARRHPAADRAGQLVQHGLHLAGAEAVRHRPVRRRGLARHRARPRPRLPGVLRQDRPRHPERDRRRRPADRAGHDPRLADGDGHRDRVGAAGVAGGAVAGRGRRGLGAGGRRAARPRPRSTRCGRCCAAS